MLTVRDVIPKLQPLALAEFATLRARLLKIAARITETATRVRIAFAAACPEADLFRSIARSCNPQDRYHRGACPEQPNPSNLQRRPRNTENHAQLRWMRIAVAQGVSKGIDS